MRELNVHKNIPVSNTKLTLGLQVGFISSHLIVDTLFPINQRAITGPLKMSVLLEAKGMPALIIKSRFILVTHTDDLAQQTSETSAGAGLRAAKSYCLCRIGVAGYVSL